MDLASLPPADTRLTAFMAAQAYGLAGWIPDEVHRLAPAGTRLRRGCPMPVVLHRTSRWDQVARRSRVLETLPDALLRAAATFRSARPGSGLLAAAVQQRLTSSAALHAALERARRTMHRAALLAAVGDVEQGAQTLSEIDFVRLCRRFALPAPEQQVIRVEPSGRRRYRDALWRRADGRIAIVEVDGALHLTAKRWWSDRLRQNELTLSDAVVLRYPSVVVRTEQELVATQLRRALLC